MLRAQSAAPGEGAGAAAASKKKKKKLNTKRLPYAGGKATRRVWCSWLAA